MMQLKIIRTKVLLLSMLLLSFSVSLKAQNKGFVECIGSVLTETKGLEGVDIKVFKGNENSDNILSASNGKFILNLDYGFNYKVVFSKNGYVSKTVEFNTTVPPEEADIVRSGKWFKIDLFKI